jgi:hypothetical protein
VMCKSSLFYVLGLLCFDHLTECESLSNSMALANGDEVVAYAIGLAKFFKL